MSSFKNMLLLLLACCHISTINCLYRHKIEPFSFDITKFEYPLEWNKVGTAVALRDTVKLVPKVEDRYGGLFMSQVSKTHLKNFFHKAYFYLFSR
jgi:hypothetical protein